MSVLCRTLLRQIPNRKDGICGDRFERTAIRMNKSNSARTAIWIALVLASATALGYGIRHVRWLLAISKSVPESKLQVQAVERDREIETPLEPERELEVAVVENNPISSKEPVRDDPKDESQPEAKAEPEPELGPWPMGRESCVPIQQGLGDWRNSWTDLDLTQEEQARLREGWRLAAERWQNMSQEQRQAQIVKWRAD
jgi:hypothetical protein